MKPSAATAEKKEKANIFVAIAADGSVWIQKRKVGLDAVRANIEKLYAESPEGTVVIQSDTKTETGILILVMDPNSNGWGGKYIGSGRSRATILLFKVSIEGQSGSFEKKTFVPRLHLSHILLLGSQSESFEKKTFVPLI